MSGQAASTSQLFDAVLAHTQGTHSMSALAQRSRSVGQQPGMLVSIHRQPGGFAAFDAAGSVVQGGPMGSEQSAGADCVWVAPQCITAGTETDLEISLKPGPASEASGVRVLLMMQQVAVVDTCVSLPPAAPNGMSTLRFVVASRS